MATRNTTLHRQAKGFRWDGVEELPYKEDDRALFKSVTRQVLFADPKLYGELRYFEVAPGGYSTLERHQHMHAVMILRGRGHCLVGEEVREPQLPSAQDLAKLERDARIAAFLRNEPI
ncbi:MAG: cupin domain-containing protein [Alphaproteobacteria bacterium]|nr:MAG: cupin domain-containing protein [Alphaproteobacteria bacterium]